MCRRACKRYGALFYPPIRLVDILKFVFLTDFHRITLCGRPEHPKPVSRIPRSKRNNSPARIAFPGCVSLAPPAGAAAARHRAPRGGLIDLPSSSIITDLLPPLFTCWRPLLSQRTGARRAGSGTRTSHCSDAHGRLRSAPSADCE